MPKFLVHFYIAGMTQSYFVSNESEIYLIAKVLFTNIAIDTITWNYAGDTIMHIIEPFDIV